MKITCHNCRHSKYFPAKTIRSPNTIFCPNCTQDMRAPRKRKPRKGGKPKQ